MVRLEIRYKTLKFIHYYLWYIYWQYLGMTTIIYAISFIYIMTIIISTHVHFRYNIIIYSIAVFWVVLTYIISVKFIITNFCWYVNPL